jgi:hypothetical protein
LQWFVRLLIWLLLIDFASTTEQIILAHDFVVRIQYPGFFEIESWIMSPMKKFENVDDGDEEVRRRKRLGQSTAIITATSSEVNNDTR